MRNIFPQEMVRYSAESHFSKFSAFSNTIYLFIVVMMLAFFISLPLIKTEISVPSRGVIRSTAEPALIISPRIAEIIKADLFENMKVNRGDTLIWLYSENIQDHMANLQQRIDGNKLYISDLVNLLHNQNGQFKTDLFNLDFRLYQQTLSDYQVQYDRAEKEYSRIGFLYKNDVIPLKEMEQIEYEFNLIREERLLYIQKKRSEWQQLLVDFELQIRDYEDQLIGLEKDLNHSFIIAPVSGFITHYSGVKPGSFISAGQAIASISPDDILVAESLIDPGNIGFITTGMNVICRIDAYHYNQWGFVSGEVTGISNEVYLVNNQPYYKVRCRLNESFLILRNGTKGHLKKGMTLTTHFRLTKRTWLQLLFDKADKWINPKRIDD